MKNITFTGKSLNSLKTFPEGVKREMGFQLDRVQRGKQPSDAKPMNSIGSGVQEVRVKDASGIYRTIFIAKLPTSVYVLHAFKKKTQKTSTQDLATAKSAYKLAVEDDRNEKNTV